MEIKQIENYVELEKLRFGHRLNVDFSMNENSLKTTIPPMLLMTLVENSFKHGVSKTMDKSWIHLDLHLKLSTLFFSSENGKRKINNSKPGISIGIGMQNLRKRLNLIYKENYTLSINENESLFGVQLNIKIFSES